jgi:DNA replication initiation complex subunit (GINS family)
MSVLDMDIFKIHRSEKDSHSLIELPEGFFDSMQDDFKGRMQTDTDPIGREALLNEMHLLNMLSDLRIKKILKGAIADAYRQEPQHDKDNMTHKERVLYDSIVAGIRDLKAS